LKFTSEYTKLYLLLQGAPKKNVASAQQRASKNTQFFIQSEKHVTQNSSNSECSKKIIILSYTKIIQHSEVPIFVTSKFSYILFWATVTSFYIYLYSKHFLIIYDQ